MRVFRCITSREIYNKYKGINERTALIEGKNTHGYDSDKEYIHFFEFSKDAEIYFKAGDFSIHELNHFLAYMVANIPYQILKPYLGYGIYGSDIPNIDYLPIPEYALPLELFKPEYIVTIAPFIPSKYANNKDFDKYLNFIVQQCEEYMQEYEMYNAENLAYHLLDSDFHEKAGIQIDDRSEKEILGADVKALLRVMEELKNE